MKTKTFDCVKMKEECQRACEKRYAGLSFEEREKRIEADILASPILGGFYRRVFLAGAAQEKAKPQVAEAGADYRAKEQP